MTGFKILFVSWLIVMICWCIVLIPYRTTVHQPQPKAYFSGVNRLPVADLFYMGDRYNENQ